MSVPSLTGLDRFHCTCIIVILHNSLFTLLLSNNLCTIIEKFALYISSVTLCFMMRGFTNEYTHVKYTILGAKKPYAQANRGTDSQSRQCNT